MVRTEGFEPSLMTQLIKLPLYQLSYARIGYAPETHRTPSFRLEILVTDRASDA